MAVYVWVAQGRAGEVKKGESEAINEAAIRTQLRRQGLKPTRVKEKPKDLLEMIPFRGGVKGKDVVIFARQFSTMISAGLPLIQCLDILASPGTEQVLCPDHPFHQGRHRGGLHPYRRPAKAPEGLQRSLYQHDRRRRGRWYPRHDPEPSGHLPGKVHETATQGQGGHDLPGRRSLHLVCRHHPAARQGRTRLPDHLRRDGEGASFPDAVPY